MGEQWSTLAASGLEKVPVFLEIRGDYKFYIEIAESGVQLDVLRASVVAPDWSLLDILNGHTVEVVAGKEFVGLAGNKLIEQDHVLRLGFVDEEDIRRAESYLHLAHLAHLGPGEEEEGNAE